MSAYKVVAGWGSNCLMPDWVWQTWMASTGIKTHPGVGSMNLATEECVRGLGWFTSCAGLGASLTGLASVFVQRPFLTEDLGSGVEGFIGLLGVITLSLGVAPFLYWSLARLAFKNALKNHNREWIAAINQFHSDFCTFAELCGFESPQKFLDAKLSKTRATKLAEKQLYALTKEMSVDIYLAYYNLAKRFCQLKHFDHYRNSVRAA